MRPSARTVKSFFPAKLTSSLNILAGIVGVIKASFKPSPITCLLMETETFQSFSSWKSLFIHLDKALSKPAGSTSVK